MGDWLRERKFKIQLISFSMMVFTSIGMYLAMRSGNNPLIWIFLGVFVVANILAMVPS